MGAAVKITSYMKPADSLTVIGMLCGFASAFLFSSGDMVNGIVALLAATFFDAIDGKVARSLGGASAFGKALDFSDIVSFGVAPAFMILHFFPNEIGYASVAVFLTASLLRLARFNISDGPSVGMPTTANGVIFPALYYLQSTFGFSEYSFVVVALVSSAIMVSAFRLRK